MIGKVSQMSLLAAIGAVAISSLSARASPNSYAGISLLRGDADPEIQSLARRAKAGSKHAQLEWGIRYEEGDGVPVDLKRARSFYRKAAATTGGAIWVNNLRRLRFSL